MAHEVLRIVDGWPTWQLPSGRLVPWIAGASNADPGDGDGEGDGDGGQDGGQAGTISRPAGRAGGGPPGTGEDEPEAVPDQWPSEAKALVKKLHKKLDETRASEREARNAAEARQTAGMSEAERLSARVRELEGALSSKDSLLRQRTMQEAFRQAGIAQRAKSPELLYKLIDADSVEWGPDGEIINAPDLVNELRRSPNTSWMFEPRAARGSADAAQGTQQQGGQPAPSFDMNAWLRRTAGTTAQDQQR